MIKTELRKIYKEKRKGLSEGEYEKLTDLILIQYQQMHLPVPDLIVSYKASAMHNEFDPENILSYCRFKNPGLSVAYPVIDDGDNTMQIKQVEADTAFELNKFEIEEPVGGNVLPPTACRFIFVPLLCADVSGNRVGFGKGYYDRFLEEVPSTALKIGFSFFPAVPQIADASTVDVPLTHLVTPYACLEF